MADSFLAPDEPRHRPRHGCAAGPRDARPSCQSWREVVDAHDLPGLARFWTQALGWKVKDRMYLDLTSSARDRDLGLEPLKRHRVAAASDGPSILAAGAIIQRRWSPRDEPRRLG
jgi:hypothetical protein